jgi:hypothetical protein
MRRKCKMRKIDTSLMMIYLKRTFSSKSSRQTMFMGRPKLSYKQREQSKNYKIKSKETEVE